MLIKINFPNEKVDQYNGLLMDFWLRANVLILKPNNLVIVLSIVYIFIFIKFLVHCCEFKRDIHVILFYSMNTINSKSIINHIIISRLNFTV